MFVGWGSRPGNSPALRAACALVLSIGIPCGEHVAMVGSIAGSHPADCACRQTWQQSGPQRLTWALIVVQGILRNGIPRQKAGFSWTSRQPAMFRDIVGNHTCWSLGRGRRFGSAWPSGFGGRCAACLATPSKTAFPNRGCGGGRHTLGSVGGARGVRQ